MTQVISLDIETTSCCDLKKFGARIYAEDPSTDVLLFAWHPVHDPAPPDLWFPGQPVPETFVRSLRAGCRVSGWNVLNFDRAVWSNICVPKYGFPAIPDELWLDSMHTAAAANLPRSLAGACKATGVGFVEDLKDQNRLRRITNRNLTPVVSPEDLQWLADRCVQDVLMEEQALLKMPPWPVVSPWVRMPAVDRRINDRGVLMDVPLVQGLARAAALETKRLDVEMDQLTRGAVPATTMVERLKDWLVDQGVELPKAAEKPRDEDEAQDAEMAGEEPEEPEKTRWRLRKSDIADILARADVPEHCRQAVRLRAEAAKASAKKLNAMLKSAGPDGRLRGAFVLMGAQGTGRWSGAVWQPHNFVRDVVANLDEVADANGLDLKTRKAEVIRLAALSLRTAIEAGRTGDPRLIETLFGAWRKDLQGRPYYDGTLPFISRMLRRTLSSPVGSLFLNGDFANIEARIPVWLAQQMNMVEAFRRGEDVYRIAASPVYNLPPAQLTKEQRQIGKVMTLFLGFAGGVNAFIPAAMNYGLSIDRETGASIVRTFRQTNPDLVNFWDVTLYCAMLAIQHPGQVFPIPPLNIVAWFMQDNALCCRLPSGRLLRYWAPRLQEGKWPDGTPKPLPDITALTIKGRAVFRRTLWRGLACENITQAIAADLLAIALDNMDRYLDDTGTSHLPVVLHCHDNALAEVAEERAEALLPIFKAAMLDAPAWAAGLPLDAAVGIEARFS